MSITSEQLKKIIEGALMAADGPLNVKNIINLFNEEQQPSSEEVTVALSELQNDYQDRGIELKAVASGYRFQAVSELAPWLCKLWEERPARYSRAFLETLAIIAYRQPVTRAEIEDVRGVAVSSHITKTLQERGWIREVGHRDVPGRPALLATTREFLDYFNLKSLDELPNLIDLQNMDEVAANLQGQLELAIDAGAATRDESVTQTQKIEHADSDNEEESVDAVESETMIEQKIIAEFEQTSNSDGDNEEESVDAVEPETTIEQEIIAEFEQP